MCVTLTVTFRFLSSVLPTFPLFTALDKGQQERADLKPLAALPPKPTDIIQPVLPAKRKEHPGQMRRQMARAVERKEGGWRGGAGGFARRGRGRGRGRGGRGGSTFAGRRKAAERYASAERDKASTSASAAPPGSAK